MNTDVYRDFLLHRIPRSSTASGGTTVVCRCFYCPDSKNPDHKHFYISIPQGNEPSLYYCHKCHASGIVTYKKLIEWDIYDDNIAMDLISHNKESMKSGSYHKYTNNVHYRVNIDSTTMDEASEIKRQYICNRLGYDYSYTELRNLKIVLNLYDVMQDNHITELTRNRNITDQLSANFLGFLSIDNAFLNMRRVCDEGLVYKTIDKRYINYKLYDKFDTSERFYTIPSSVNLNDKERVPVHIAEGPFDILSIYNLRNRAPGIYTSIAGSNYRGIAMYFLENYKLPYTELHYYPDNDKHGKTHNIQKIAEYLKPTRTPIFVHRNTYPGEKDFGVKPDHISETIMQV